VHLALLSTGSVLLPTMKIPWFAKVQPA